MTVLAAIGGIVSAVGSIASAQAQAQAAKYNAKVNERNAVVATQMGAGDKQRQDRENRVKLAGLRAAYGDAGISFEGDALTVFNDSATQAELDKATIGYHAKLRATGYSDQATLDRMNASAASTAGIFGAFSDLVGAGRSILQAA